MNEKEMHDWNDEMIDWLRKIEIEFIILMTNKKN